MVASRRFLLGVLCLVIAAVIAIGVRIRVEQLSPTAQSYIYGSATMYFETDRTVVWRVGDCVTLRWDVERIKAIHWSQGPTVGVNTTTWCPNEQVAIPYFTIDLQDGRVIGLAPFDIETIRTRLMLMLMPLLILAGWYFGFHRLIARAARHIPGRLRPAFSVDGQIHILLVVLFVGLNAVVLWNALRQPSGIGYDAEDHYSNVRVFSQGRLPTKADSNEFFSPPVPYIVPAIMTWVNTNTNICGNAKDSCNTLIRKFGQLQNVFLSLVISFLLLQIGARLNPDNPTPRAVSLFLLATLPVYYKTFAFMRGEPFIVMFTLLLCHRLLSMTDRKPRLMDGVLIGLYGGAIVLSRQWGAFILIGIALWWICLLVRNRLFAWRLLSPGLVASVIALLLAGWYYVAMAQKTGTALAFNRSAGVTDSGYHADPALFFTGLGGGHLFIDPFTPSLDGQAIPAFYSEIWGDYWGYFYLPRPPIFTLMPAQAVRYMGEVNAVSLITTLVLLGAFLYGVYSVIRLFLRPPIAENSACSLFTLCIIASLTGFTWFLIHYPSDNADTAKATYMLQIFPLLFLLAGQIIYRIEKWRPKLAYLLMTVLVLVAVHNLPMFFTRIG